MPASSESWPPRQQQPDRQEAGVWGPQPGGRRPAQGRGSVSRWGEFVYRENFLLCGNLSLWQSRGGAGGQQGFLGCIRSLRMNGVTLDLEERAKVTSGFKSGCSGHCTSYGANCENGGKCIEKYHGYSCDCSSTAYDGTFCNKADLPSDEFTKYKVASELLKFHKAKTLNEIESLAAKFNISMYWMNERIRVDDTTSICVDVPFLESVRPPGTALAATTKLTVYPDVGAFFEEGMWLRYNFQAPGSSAKESDGRSENSRDPQNGAPDLAREEIRFSFSTTKAPCILLYVSSFTTDFLAVLVKPTGSLQIRYSLGGTREPYNIDVDHRSMANGQPHSVNVTRHERTITLKVILVYLTDFLHDSNATMQPKLLEHSFFSPKHIKSINHPSRKKLDHYPSVSYRLPSSSDTLFNSPKSLFLGKVIGLRSQLTKAIGCCPSFQRMSGTDIPEKQDSISAAYKLKRKRKSGIKPKTGKIDQEIHKYNTPGFTGCLSRVQFNQIAPLKAALRQTNASAHVHVQGELVESNCGASPLTLSPMSSATDPWHLDHLDSASADFPYNPGQGQAIRNGVNRNSAIIGGVIAVVIFTILCTLVFLIRYMFRHKGTYHTNEAKGAESAESADAAIMSNDPNFTETIDESKKEWLI
ncbi:hypothetical protein E2I00_008145 [Balaenoptera physalus]|uniref:Contactin-associated protein-like 2 n=1 Tax=Balaenoptera physalus TaxID=9770 RepID=A0A643C8I4_BALPH|nr:hypothetical protein E2I00_008145 [Balaenoptera physalus]